MNNMLIFSNLWLIFYTGPSFVQVEMVKRYNYEYS